MTAMPTRRSFLQTIGAAAALGSALPSSSAALPQDLRHGAGATANLPAPIAALTDRRSEAVPISIAEREHRIHRARELMAQNNLDALVLTAGTSLAYFTGLRWSPSERLLAWLLPARGNPAMVCPAFEEARVRELMDAHPAGHPGQPGQPDAAPPAPQIYTWNEDQSPFSTVARALKDRSVTAGRIGVEERTPFVFADSIAQALPAAHLVSATPVTAGCRSVKSPAELALLRLANQVTLSVYKAAFQSAEPGMSNRHVSDLIALAYDRVGFPGEASCEVGPSSALPHGSVQPQTIQTGEVVLLDDGCTVDGYKSDISRSFVLGQATDLQKHVFDLVHKAQTSALAAARPGVPCDRIDAVAREVIANGGFGPGYKFFSHRLGHGIGMDGHEWPYLVGGNHTPLAPAMTFSDEPGIYIPGEFGIRLEDCWFVTPNGAEFFTPQSPSLEHPFG